MIMGSLVWRDITPADYGFLYELLCTRTMDISISSTKIPTWRAHVAYWESSPHREAHMLILGGLPIGYCYLSKLNEVAVHLVKNCQGRGIGPQVVRHFCRSHAGEKLYANVSPYNLRSQHMFEKLGWRELQRTYIFTQPNGD